MHFETAHTAASITHTAAADMFAVGQTATLLLDDTMQVLSADAAGSALLETNDSIRLTFGRFSTGTMGLDHQIRSAIVGGTAISGLLVGDLSISLLPIKALSAAQALPQAVLIIQLATIKTEDNVEAVRHGCALTRAETEILRLVFKGLNTIEAAGVLGLAKSTVRTHLQKLFAKTDTSRQSELVHFVATYRIN